MLLLRKKTKIATPDSNNYQSWLSGQCWTMVVMRWWFYKTVWGLSWWLGRILVCLFSENGNEDKGKNRQAYLMSGQTVKCETENSSFSSLACPNCGLWITVWVGWSDKWLCIDLGIAVGFEVGRVWNIVVLSWIFPEIYGVKFGNRSWAGKPVWLRVRISG